MVKPAQQRGFETKRFVMQDKNGDVILSTTLN